MLVIVMEAGSPPDERARWTGRRHDEDWPGRRPGSSPAVLSGTGLSGRGLFDVVFGALHDGEQVALGLDCPLSVPAGPGPVPASAAGAGPPAPEPGLAELGRLLDELGRWRPWTRVSTSLARWRANTSVLVWQAVPAPGGHRVAASAAVEAFFRQPPGTVEYRKDVGGGAVVNLAAVAALRAGLLADVSELSRPAVTIAVTGHEHDAP